jgi:Asp-tRNA(Asn)/Glu-tRNA(Gln) amidotransferase A subunit family amidase
MQPEERRVFLMQLATVAAAGASMAAIGAPEATAKATAAGAAPPNQSKDAPMDAITAGTFAEAEKLAGITFTEKEREQLLRTIGELREQLAARIALGALPNELAPADVFRAELPGKEAKPVTTEGKPDQMAVVDVGVRQPTDQELFYADIPTLASMMRVGSLKATRLTEVAIQRMLAVDPKLHAVVEPMLASARDRALRLDQEGQLGSFRGPLHGIPYVVKDIFDVEGASCSWGAEAFKGRMSERTAKAVAMLDAAGAVPIAKVAVGALAYGDIWYGGQCRNPWNLEQGSSGSSAGSAACVAAGVVPFALGTETLGSIVSPATRCGISGLRPTFGRVSRAGVMSLSWSMDKVGVLARSAHDAGVVLGAINGFDPEDASSVDKPFHWNPKQDAKGLVVGYVPAWFEGKEGAAWKPVLDALRDAGVVLKEIEAPKIAAGAVGALTVPLVAEAAACFEELTRGGGDDTLAWQADEAWPNTFRRAWFIPAIELVQAQRLRRRAMEAMHDFFMQADAVVCPPFAGQMLLLTNAAGQPCAVARCGFEDPRTPRTVTVMSRLFDEGTALRVAGAIEARLGKWERFPAL